MQTWLSPGLLGDSCLTLNVTQPLLLPLSVHISSSWVTMMPTCDIQSSGASLECTVNHSVSRVSREACSKRRKVTPPRGCDSVRSH